MTEPGAEHDVERGVRGAYLDLARQAVELVGASEVQGRWDDESALDGMTVGAVAVHLVAAGVGITDGFVAADPPDGNRALPAHRWLAGVPTDTGAEVHQGVRTRSVEQASMGPGAAATWAKEVLASVEGRLAEAPPDRRVRVMGGVDMFLDDFLVTRLVELAVHFDDLAFSAGVDTPPLPEAAVPLVVDCCVGAARRRHGDLAVVRALTRPARADERTLHIY